MRQPPGARSEHESYRGSERSGFGPPEDDLKKRAEAALRLEVMSFKSKGDKVGNEH